MFGWRGGADRGVVGACGGTEGGGLEGTGNKGGSGASSGASASGGGGGVSATGGGGGITIDAPTGGASGFGGECATDSHKGEQVPLDLYIMLDRSGSMTDKTSAGPTKWDAIKQALTSFVTDPGSADLGVGLQYFPLNKAGVPESCTTSTECGSSGPCVLRTCTQNGGTIVPCENNTQCPGPLNSCIDLGYCTGNPGIYCAPVGSTACGKDGQCVKLTTSICADATSCVIGDYANPAVPIALLSTNATAIVSSINAQDPFGGTSTAPALQGAISQATSYNQANPTHRVAVVLATDGLPTACDPQAIDKIAAFAQTAYGANPSIVTFVIGVFGTGDKDAQTNLDAIALAGGSTAAFMVDTGQDVTQQFLSALAQIKGKALACEFLIPSPEGGQIDVQKVNIQVTTSSGTQTIYYVRYPEKCDPVNGGWYYDKDPAAGETPTKILVCPSTCNAFKLAPDAEVKIVVGCPSQPPPA